MNNSFTDKVNTAYILDKQQRDSGCSGGHFYLQ